MKTSFIAFAAAALALLPAAHATTVVLSAVPTARQVTDSNGTVLTSGSVWVGTFSSTSFTFSSTLTVQENVDAIAAAGGWERFGTDTLASSVNAGVSDTLAIRASPAGRIGGTITDNTFGATKADFFDGKPLYVWLFNGSSPATSTELGIFRATDATVPWVFATNAGGVGDSVTYSTTLSGAPTITSFGGAGSTASGGLQLVAAVPEPSTMALGALAAIGLAFRRRRALPLVAAGVAALALPAIADEPNSPVGFVTRTLSGGGSPASPRISVIAPALTQPVVWEGRVVSISSNPTGPSVITVSGNPWTDNQFDGANGGHYVEGVSRTDSGASSDITTTAQGTAPDGSSITTSANLGAFVAVGETIKIRRHVTLGSFLGISNEAGLLASDDPATADEVLIYQGAAAVSYFYYTGDPDFPAGWYDSEFNSAPGEAARTVIAPGQGVVVKRKVSSPLSFVSIGSAKVRDTRLPVLSGINVVGTTSAAPLTLAESGLHTGDSATGIAASDDPSTADEVTLYTPTGQLTYFYYSGDPDYPAGWYDSGFTLAPGEAGNAVIPLGSALVIHRKSGRPAFGWSQPAPAAF